MAIQRMKFIKIIGSIEDLHEILKKLVLYGKIHFDLENTDAYNDSYIIHEYEAVMMGEPPLRTSMDFEKAEKQCAGMMQTLENLGKGLGVKYKFDVSSILSGSYGIEEGRADLDKVVQSIGPTIDEINAKMAIIEQYKKFKEKISSIIYKDLNFDDIAKLNYFDYEIGYLSSENKNKLRRNYGNISAIVLNIGVVKDSKESIYVLIFPKQFREETLKLLSLYNWDRLIIPEGLQGSVSQMIKQADERIQNLYDEIDELSKLIDEKKNETVVLLNKIFTAVKLEEKIISLGKEIEHGENTFVLNAWIRKDDEDEIRKMLEPFSQKIIMELAEPDDMERQLTPPTQFRNKKFFKPFERVINLYGLPSYNEIDPTPFVAITFCLMFGIMFGDIGQGMIYLIAGLLISKKRSTIGQLLVRLGGSSTLFGFIYGSFFGLEQSELPWLPSLIGKPLDPKNIPAILLTGVIFGLTALTVSFVLGIINSIRMHDLEEGIFGKNGLAGYAFMIGLVLSIVAVIGVVNLPVGIPISILAVSFVVMMAKLPLANLVTNKRPLIRGNIGSYFMESIFEGIETVLSTLSNAISFIRVGAFALNHAGLFLAFLVMSELTKNIFSKLIILILGNLLILSLEGLVVFIQCLRLEYYEMFGKYFKGGGIPFKPAKINN